MLETSKRRGFTLIAVLVIVGSALLVATGLLFVAQAEMATSSHAANAAQSRSLIESGIDVVVSRLNEQRERILDGELPELEEQYEIYELGSIIGVVRLREVTAEGDHLDPQAAKLDVNHPELTAEMLVDTGAIEPEVAEAIISYRNSRPDGIIHSLAELLGEPAISAELLYGPLDDLVDENSRRAATIEHAATVLERDFALIDILTVFAVEPELQRDGRRRINLNVPWSEELGERLDDRFGEGAGELVKGIIDGGTTFDDDSAIFRVLRTFEVPPDDWPDILDALTTSDSTYRFGRVDINTASEQVLAALPGITEAHAAEIVRTRDVLTADERATIAWPVIHGIIAAEAYEELGPWLTTRSWTYRLRLAAGEVDADNPTGGGGELQNRVEFEVVVDLAAPRPRVAHLRDVTMLPTAVALARLEPSDGNLTGQRQYEVDDDGGVWPATEEEESWPNADLADETDDAQPGDAVAAPPSDPRERLGRWR